ncbi:hypothetical protein CDO73_15845 [Saccharibacillus sp. O23]|uniref:hypothetical protein n=1 Tax=Saccharibacillus sp. O23 TaxID=2009338 RepID=UPI000B4E5A58|nr:hypothetical protein [Saccharibacillus sp. O23]OWR29138.1 hypothetical protein CDO73_15845 [Saccharibacillus sp. O23]
MSDIERIGPKEWTDYVRGTLPEPARQRLERLLGEGDELAFDYYMAALGNVGGDLPALTDADGFSERVMAALPDEPSAKSGRLGRKWTEPIVLYAVAAAAALLLTFSGTFDRLGEQAQRAADEAGKVSYSQKLAEGASSWFGGVKAKGENEHESTTK